MKIRWVRVSDLDNLQDATITRDFDRRRRNIPFRRPFHFALHQVTTLRQRRRHRCQNSQPEQNCARHLSDRDHPAIMQLSLTARKQLSHITLNEPEWKGLWKWVGIGGVHASRILI